MADWSDRSVKQIPVLRQGTSVAAYQYEATAQPSGITFRFILTAAERALGIVDAETEQWADAFNQKSLVSGVRSISTYEDVNANNNIYERMLVTVASDSGISTEELNMPQAWLQQVTFNQQVEAAREYLNRVEGAG